MKKVSIIIPVFQAESFLSQSVGSVLLQTYKDWELLLIDDGSTDNSLELCKQYEKSDSRIIVISNSNHGVSYTRNCGLDTASGDLVLFLDSDDYLTIDCLETCVREIENNNLDMLQFSLALVDIRGGKHNEWRERTEILDGTAYLSSEKYLLCAGGSIISRGLISDIRFPEGIKYGEDRLFMLQVISHCKRIKRIDNLLYNYVSNPNSASSKMSSQSVLASIDATLDIRDRYPMLRGYLDKTLIDYMISVISNRDTSLGMIESYHIAIGVSKVDNPRPVEWIYLLLSRFSVRLSIHVLMVLFNIKDTINKSNYGK